MTIAAKLALLARTKKELRLRLGLDSSVPFSDYAKLLPYNPAVAFLDGQKGAIYDHSDLSTLWQDAAGTVPVTKSGDPIARALDKSGNNNHAVQTLSAARPTYSNTPSSIVLDKVDDALVINVPTGGWIGTMVLATVGGTASYGINIPAGNYSLGGPYFPSNKIVGAVFRNGEMTTNEKAQTESYFVEKGAVRSFTGTTSLVGAWRGWDRMTSFPVISIPNITHLDYAWYQCTALSDFALIDTSSVISFLRAWQFCSSLISFPLLNTSKLVSANATWYGCTSLVNVPVNMFNNIKGGDFTNAFGLTKLSQASIDGILVSLVTSGIATGTRVFNQSGGSAPSATGNAAINTLRSRGWTVTVTGGY